MEQLLGPCEQICSLCKSQRLFRLSKYGCVFTCKCETPLDFQKALKLFIRQLEMGVFDLSFVPIIEGISTRGTLDAKIAVVELECLQRLVSFTFYNFSNSDIENILSSFSLSLRIQTLKTANNRFSIPLELLDFLVDELQAISRYPLSNYLISQPSHELVSVVRSPSPTTLPPYFLPVDLCRVLQKHQIEGLEQILRFRGRALLADEMGVGKTLEALAAVSALNAFPLLLVTPSALKVMWADEIEKYLHSQVQVNDVHIIKGSNDALGSGQIPKVVIVSYHMVAVLGEQLMRRNWKCLICDESHFLLTNANNSDAHYTRHLVSLGKRVRYCILVSGTPTLGTPFTMFNQLDMLLPGVFGKTRWHFALQFCHMRFDPYIQILECIRPIECTTFLRAKCMIRRLKRDVLELPPKKRIILRVACTLMSNEKSTFQDQYSLCWRRKRKGIFETIEYCCQKYETLVLFAHHLALIDALGLFLDDKHISFIRIDGRVGPEQRGDLLMQFEGGKVKVAVIGITACATGISLALAQCAIFCELPPDASWMIQAEDRLHRQGQEREVSIYYILGVHSEFDMAHFSRILENYQQVRKFVDDESKAVSIYHTSRMDSSLPRFACVDSNCANTRNTTFSSVSTNQRLLFLISKNTGRIHVKNPINDSFYITFSMEEAIACVRNRSHTIWDQLDRFLLSLEKHSLFYKRQMVNNVMWCSSDFKIKNSESLTGTSIRYLSSLKIGWGFWWQVKRQGFRKNLYYFTGLKHIGSLYMPLCLNCSCLLNISGNFSPGLVFELETDVVMFCNGKCREAFFMKRSSGSIRRSVSIVDRGNCANCHVNCELLCMLMANAQHIDEREEILRKHHPQFALFPRLYRNFVNNPTPGNCWHADHIIPVSHGGGQSTLDNIQTLCVVCHALKTSEDIKYCSFQIQHPKPQKVDTTVVFALEHLHSVGGGRVSSRRHR
ncbi:unnamed protein product [Phytomonas sp. Hart1]|nr:unnamed protein product [Phytomonas sp. Hart1]|eukprot:CCW67656.1 unnamed protein product [Phytomonas sp. isolate Hart1]